MNTYLHAAVTHSRNTDETLHYAFLTGPKTWTALAKAIEFLKKNPICSQVTLQPPDDDCLLLDVPNLKGLTVPERKALRKDKFLSVNPQGLIVWGYTQSQYTFTIEVHRRKDTANVILVVGDDPCSEARCLIDMEIL